MRGAGRGGQHDSRLVRMAVRYAQGGDGEAMRFLYVRFAPEVRRHIAGLARDAAEADDVTRDVFAGLPTSIDGYQPREGPFEAWILGVARDSLRTRR
jgi:RNA polymerase sigma-70 factor, ECF subfamily